MMKNRRYLLKGFSLIVILITALWGMAVNAEITAESRVSFEADFENGMSALKGTISGTNISKDTVSEKSVLKADSTLSSAVIEVRTSENPISEATLISMDVCADRTTTRAYMDIFDSLSGSVNATMTPRGWYITQEGTISYFENFMPPTGTKVNTSFVYEAEKWYRLELWIDYTDKKVFYFVDGKEIACLPITVSPESVLGFRVTVDKMNGGAIYLFDNIKVINFLERGGEIGIDGVMGVPENFENPVTLEYKTNENNLGFIFMTNNVKFNGTLKNVKETTRNADVKLIVRDENGNIEAQDEFNKSLSAGETAYFEFNTYLDRYGFYYLKTVVSDSETGETLAEKEFQFSVANGLNGIRNNKFGFADHTANGHGVEELERKIRQMADMGVKTLRVEFNSHNTDYTSGTYELDESHKRMVDVASANGFDLIGILTYGKVPPVTENEYLKWQEYVRAVVSQLKGKFKNISYEVWNEYNAAGFNYIGATSEDYSNLLKATYEAVKDVDKTAKVTGFAVSPQNIEDYPETVTIDAIDWMREVLEKGGGDYMDAASIHIYTHRYPENTTVKRAMLLGQTRELLDEFGYSDMEIDISEIGWTTDGITTERDKADWVVRWMAMNYEMFDRVCFYVNQEKQSTSTFENLYGFTRAWTKYYAGDYPTYGAKYSYLSVANFNAQIGNATKIGRCDMGNSDVYNYKFKDELGNNIYIAWNRKTTSEEFIATESESVRVYDVFGNPYDFEMVEGGINITLTSSPVYIVEVDLMPKINVLINSNEETVTVSGTVQGEKCEVGLTVSETDNTRKLLYVEQGYTNSTGKFGFTFKNNIPKGKYLVKIGYKDGVIEKESKLYISVPEIKLYSGNSEIKSLSQLSAGETITARWSGVEELIENNNAVAIVGQYKNGVLKSVELKTVEAGQDSAEISVKYSGNETDIIKMIFWDADKYSPLMAMYTIAGKE